MKLGPIDTIILLGGGLVLKKLALWSKSQKIPIHVITSPRHSKELLEGESLKKFLENEKINYVEIDDINSSSNLNFLNKLKNPFYLSLGAPWIFKKETIYNYFNNQLFNSHGTRLPQNRGGGGFSWQILTGNRFGFSVLHLIDENLDTGDIIQFEEFLYPATCRKPIDYIEISTEKDFNFLVDFINKNKTTQSEIIRITQPEYLSSYWPRISTDLNGWIDWSNESTEIEQFICAFDNPYPGAKTLLNNETVIVKNVSLNKQDGIFHSFQSGLIYRKGKDWLCVCVKGCGLIIEEIYDEKGNNIFDKIKIGDRLHTPTQLIQESKKRPIFTPKGLR